MTAAFDRDPAKDAGNQCKHGVSFAEAQLAFLDPGRVLALDTGHSQAEQRYYCFGHVAEGILTVRFTSPIEAMSFELLAPAFGAEARSSMKRTRKYTDERLGRLEIVDDFLPAPDQLVLKEDEVKVTISLSKKSVDFFKAHAARSKVSYQRMIRSLLDAYADQHTGRPSAAGSAARRSRQAAGEPPSARRR